MVALMLATLLGLAGLVIDLGGLFVAKSELQSAVDSCALAAAQELDGAPDAITRATNAGLTAGQLNKAQYQSSSVNLSSADITFSASLNGTFSTTMPYDSALYAQCSHTITSIAAYFIQFVGGPLSNSVSALAKAKRVPAQNVCLMPLGILSKTGGTALNLYKFTKGEWITVFGKSTSFSPGEMGWFNIDNTNNSAAETSNEIELGYCNNSDSLIGHSVGTPGVKTTVEDVWNAKFGIYKNASNAATSGYEPDFTGYAYTSTNWKNAAPQSAYDGVKAAGSDATAANFKTKRSNFANYADTGTTVAAGDAITGLTMPGGFSILATAGVTGQHHQYGKNKRLVAVAVLNPSGPPYTIANYACMLMLQPVKFCGSCADVQLEFLGLVNAPQSPCTGIGLPGGSTGPMVPVLVQ